MSLTNSPSWMYNPSTGFYNGVATQSLRFDNDSSAYLTRTPSSAANRQTFTISCWVKRSNLGLQGIFSAKQTKDDTTALVFENSDQLLFTDRPGNSRNIDLRTNRLFRDVGAWYHIVVRVDTTQGTSSNRVKISINGVQETSFATSSYPSQNYNVAYWNNTQSHRIGVFQDNSANYYDGYIAEFNNVGSAQAPTAFGEYKNDIWIPKEYSGSYGTNGFRLEFNGNGNDSSGNGNNFTTSGVSTHDYVSDSPENNFSTLDSLSIENSQVRLDEGGLNATAITGGSNWGNVFSTISLPSSGKFYVECRQAVQSGSGNQGGIGVINKQYFKNENSNIVWDETYDEGFDGLHLSLFNNVLTAKSDGADNGTVSGLTASSYILMLAIDIDNGKVFGGQNGTWMNSANPAAGTGQIATRSFSTGDTVVVHESWGGSNNQEGTANFGQDSTFHGSVTAGGNSDGNGVGDFKYTVPSGFLALCTANLPDPTGVDPNEDESPTDYFNTVTYTGTGSTQSRTGVGFQPDFLWIKQRNTSRSHRLLNSSMFSYYLASDNTNNQAPNDVVNSLDSDGFTLLSPSAVNQSGGTYAAWNWKANGGTTSSNTSGSITSTVQANQSAGFSILTYTGNGSSGATIGHGLSQAPDLIITKHRTGGSPGSGWIWPVFHHRNTVYTAATGGYFRLQDVNGTTNNTETVKAVGSSTYTVGNAGHINLSSGQFVAYVFHEVEGFSRFGRYTGNGSTNGPMVYTGFRPAFIIIKAYSNNSWMLYDNKRQGFNEKNDILQPNTNNSESTADGSNQEIDFLSNGFKLRNSAGHLNNNNTSFIYIVFAEHPFKYANAR